jgi:asparagine synthase (glutamine-hydrolysing)
MCGIVGIVHRDPARPVAPETIRTMCRALAHRGPDDEGTFVAGSVGLGMRRLSIIDLAGGRQPISNEDGTRVIVFNGEIYNYRVLRSELELRGHRFRSSSDTESIVHLYEERGADCVSQLRGMFAFAIWDAEAATLLLSRDRFGIKPLYYVAASWGLAFASELKALVAAGLTTRELDWEALNAYFQLGYIPAPASPFRDVRKLEPGHWLRWRNTGELTIRPYWDLPRGEAPAPAGVERRTLEWIDESVAAHLISDVPVAAFLSGGLDSSAVVASMAVAARQSGEVPHAFTARYHGSGAEAADETDLARRLAERYGVQLTIVDITPDARDVFEPIVHALDEPHADDSAIPTWSLSQVVGDSYKVALTGIGGDELFGGYRRHFGLLAAARYSRLPRAVRAAAAVVGELLPDGMGRELAVDRIKRFLRTGAGAARTTPDRYLGLLSRANDALRERLYAPAVRDVIAGNGAQERFRQLHHDAGSPEGLAAALYLDYKTYLADDVLALSDRLSMAHSLEIRVPLVDHVLVEKVFPLPARLKLPGWKLKALLRRALVGRLPEAHFHAPKRGFVGPTAAWLRHELRAMVLDELSASRIARLGYFDPDVVTRLLDEHFSRRHNREGILWALLCFSTWHRLFVEGTVEGATPRPRITAGVQTTAGSPG